MGEITLAAMINDYKTRYGNQWIEQMVHALLLLHGAQVLGRKPDVKDAASYEELRRWCLETIKAGLITNEPA